MPNAVFIGFTGTPLLKEDKQTSLEVFGRYIHTYKFSEAVEDEVVLGLIYEARDIEQKLGSEDKIEAWFEAKTKGLNYWQKDELKKKWATMQAVVSSKSRIDRVVQDIVFDFNVRPRLSSQRGNAILVASSIDEACKYYEAFQSTEMKGRCALILHLQSGPIHLGELMRRAFAGLKESAHSTFEADGKSRTDHSHRPNHLAQNLVHLRA